MLEWIKKIQSHSDLEFFYKQSKTIYVPYTPLDKYSYKRKQNITIDEDIHQVLLIIAVWFIVRILLNNILLITWFVARVTRRVPHMDLKMPTLPDYLSLHSVFSGVSVAGSLVFLCSVLFIPLSFFFWPLLLNVFCRLAFDYLLVSSNYSYPHSCY
jgi:hypothetical protein